MKVLEDSFIFVKMITLVKSYYLRPPPPTNPHAYIAIHIISVSYRNHTSIQRQLKTCVLQGVVLSVSLCAHHHHTIAALKRYFPASIDAPMSNSEQIDHPFSNHTYTKSMPNHIHHHYAPFVTLTFTTHIISSTTPTYVPHCHPCICGRTPPVDCRGESSHITSSHPIV